MIIEELNPATIDHLEAPSLKTNKWMRPAFIRIKTKVSELEDYELGTYSFMKDKPSDREDLVL
jgi:hypothetical protein